ncbi:penicillin amidase [Leucobacter komagatae]|uniref:Penicillin amidase n=1 Tax=Leucobacter komagatae TaxID=55969 RepID=A0A542Y4N4_9MICO|nr:penicillin acylase family protein [Leucobacter komagatae]TQL43033.1 penicillin amidase [Leucobacter komagatae]
MTQAATDLPQVPAGSTPKKKRRALRVIGWIVASLVVIALVAAGLGVWTVQRSFPTVSGTVTAAGLSGDVTVQRDERGIATITADTSEDLFFSQGYVHAQDRFWEMDFRRHLTSARLSELFGESQVGTDSFLRTLGWQRIAEQEYADLSPEVRAYYDSYAAGVNAYLAERSGSQLSLEYAVLGLQNSGYEPEPWEPAESIAWLKAMAWDLRTNIEDETARALQAQYLDADQLADLYPGYPFEEHPVILADDPAGRRVVAVGKLEQGAAFVEGQLGKLVESLNLQPLEELLGKVDSLITQQGEGIGSNSWVVSGELTTTGKPLLANDPHLGAALPSVWTQMQLRCSTVSEACPFDVAGFSFSGLPGIVIGHNADIAWGFTNLTTDVADLFVESVDGDKYWYDDEWHDMTTREETIKVAGGDDVTLTVRETGHGPIVSGLTGDFTAIAEKPRSETPEGKILPVGPGDIGGTMPYTESALALRWTALDAGSTPEAIFMLNRAENFTDFREAASKFDVPGQNLIYADPDGNIGYQAPGKLPIRAKGQEGYLPTPGWSSDYDWQGFIPFEEQPWSYNPKSGYIVTANNAIVNDDYAYFLSRDWDYGYRAARIVELLEAKIAEGPVSALDLAEIHMDNQMPAAKALKDAYAGVAVDDAGVQGALELLAGWDGQNAMDSAPAAFANVLWEHLTERMVSGRDGDIPRDDQSRFARMLTLQLEDPKSEWLTANGTEAREEFLAGAASDAYAELTQLQSKNSEKWNWGKLHAITLTHGTFGESGIAPIEALFNRGPYDTSGGSGVVNATGWALGEGYATSTVPSMRMVIDVSDWDASTWQNLTGQSGHAFHKNYTDQVEGWATGEQYAWAFTPEAVGAAAKDTLTLTPAK